MADKCVEEILKAIPDADRKDVERIVQEMSDIRAQAFIDGLANPNSQYRQKAMKMLDGYRRAAMKFEIKTLQNIAKRRENEAFISNEMFGKVLEDQKINLTFKDPKMKGLEARLVGTNVKGIEGSRLSVNARKDAYADILGRGFLSELSPEDLDTIAAGSANRQIFVDMWEIAHGRQAKSGSANIAKALVNLDRAILSKLNDSGAWIDELEGHVFVQSHDSDAIRAAKFDQWLGDILPLLDHEKTFNGDILPVKDKNAYMKAIYDDIIEGNARNLQEESADQVIKIIGMPSNMAKRLGQSRKLHFKDGDSLFDYNEKYGTKDLNEYIYTRIHSTARNAALMEVFGTNPKAMFERMIQGADNTEKAWLQNIWAELDGSTSIPGKSSLAVAGNVLRSSQNISKLGRALFASIPDMATRSANLFAANGQSLSQSINRTFMDALKNMSEVNRRQVARMTGVGIEAMLGRVYDRFSAADGMPGIAAKFNDWGMRLSGLKHWTDANRSAHAQSLSAWLGANAGSDFASLPQGKNLSRYGIGVPEWEVIRQGVEAFGGESYISLDSIEKMRPDAIAAAMSKSGISDVKPKMVEAFRRQTRDKLAAYFNQEVKVAMNEGGAYERALFLRGTSQDQVMGQVARFIQQFKTYPLTVLTKSVDDLMLGDGATSWSQAIKSGKANFQGLAFLAVGTTLMAYVAESFKAVSQNRTPPDPSNPKVWQDLMQRGGMLGLYGDFLLGEYDSRHGRNALSAAAGPVLGQFVDVMDLKTKMMQAATDEDVDASDAAVQAMRLITNNIPGSNLFWLRGAADYMLLYSIQEHLNPGFIERTRARIQERGQDFLVEPMR